MYQIYDPDVIIDTFYILLCSFLIFFMQIGFILIELGLLRKKNTINVISKGILDYCISCTIYFFFGYAIMFGKGNYFMGFSGFFMIDAPNPTEFPLLAFVVFQMMFVSTSATIVSGGVAERMQLNTYIFSTALIAIFVYPVVGHWIWGEGWLEKIGFVDFAGAAVIHFVGGSIALIGTIVLGPRIGRFEQSKAQIQGHNLTFMAIGVFILWFSWFGFNAGSSFSILDIELISRVVINTNLSATTAGLTAWVIRKHQTKKSDVVMLSSGVVSGLIAITAACAYITPIDSMVIGLIAGFIVVKSYQWLEKKKIDDPVGAISMHFFNGGWGVLAFGLFAQTSLDSKYNGFLYGGGIIPLLIQLLGLISIALFCWLTMGTFYVILKKINKLRVTAEEEINGLDIFEHGMKAYED